MSRLSERILLRLSRPPESPPYPGGSDRMTLENCLDFLLKTVPDFIDMVRGRRVLDFGCGHGYQSARLARDYGCEVIGLDLPRESNQVHWARLQHDLNLPNLTLTTERPSDPVDVAFSCSSFEHFTDPEEILRIMTRLVRPGGLLVIAFAEPWWSPRGAHMDGFTRLPWVNVWFSEQTVINVRRRFVDDGATRYEDVEGGLNRMTVRRFEALMASSGLEIQSLRLFSVKGLPIVAHLPVLREFLVSAASCVLRRPLDIGTSPMRLGE